MEPNELQQKFIDYIEEELSWNHASVTLQDDGTYEYQCMAGSSVIPEIKEACEKIGLKVSVGWITDAGSRREGQADDHEYWIKLKTPLENIRGALTGKTVGITETYIMKHVKDFTNWRLNEGAVKDKLMEIAEKAVATMTDWMPEPEKPFNRMAEEELEELITDNIESFFSEVDSEYDKTFLQGNKDAIISTISTLLA